MIDKSLTTRGRPRGRHWLPLLASVLCLLVPRQVALLGAAQQEVPPQQGTDRPPITNRCIAVFVIDFPDTPQSIKNNYFPTISALRTALFNGQITAYLNDMSYGQFAITGDVFGYFTHQNPGFVNGSVTESPDVVNISTINIPGFDINLYDAVAFVSINDAGLAGGRAGLWAFLVNGVSYSKTGVFVPIHIGYAQRDAQQWPTLSNSLVDVALRGDIPIGTDAGISDQTFLPFPFSLFDRTFSHELMHTLGVGHATSRTNGTSHDYEPEVTDNNCLCYPSNPSLGGLLDRDYGNNHDVMGFSYYGVSLNTVFRDYFGWTNASNRYSIKDYGHFSTTLNPLNASSGTRAVEIRIPFQFNGSGLKNRGYFLEVRTAGNRWDSMLSHGQLHENNNGIMVLKTDGYTSQLLDASPSANIHYYGQVVPDMRDVVLKQGMVYENNEIRLSNVRNNGDGSFSLDVDVLRPLASPVPALLSASVSGKKLFVNGINFQPGAVIEINGVAQGTRNDEQAPTALLIAKKGGKRILPGQSVILTVLNPDGARSAPFPFAQPGSSFLQNRRPHSESVTRLQETPD